MHTRTYRGVDGKFHYTVLGFFGEEVARSGKGNGFETETAAVRAAEQKKIEAKAKAERRARMAKRKAMQNGQK